MKQTCHNNIPVTVQPSVWLLLVFACIMLPLPWVFAWILAVAVHEFGHVVGIMLLKIPIHFVTIKLSGTYIQASPMLSVQEMFVAALGPIIGLLPVCFARWIPHTAVCAVVQFFFNILPVTGFDGGRVLYCILQRFLSPGNAAWCMRGVQTMLVLLFIFVGLIFRRNIIVLLAIGAVLLRSGLISFPCKRRQQIVQWSK